MQLPAGLFRVRGRLAMLTPTKLEALVFEMTPAIAVTAQLPLAHVDEIGGPLTRILSPAVALGMSTRHVDSTDNTRTTAFPS